MKNIVVMTDLDGTLLDHYSYSFNPALPALEKLRELGIPLILNSSKTASEMLLIRKSLDNHDPFVVENGSTLFVPAHQGKREVFECVIYGLNRKDILDALEKVQEQHRFHFQAFSAMSTEELVTASGLAPAQARQALSRHFTEPLLWQDSEENLGRFSRLLEPFGIRTIKGGRFVHLSGHANKSQCIPWLREHYSQLMGQQPLIIALGDSENDVPMLKASDYPVLVHSPVKNYPALEHPALIHTEANGPAGWNTAVLDILATLREHCTLY